MTLQNIERAILQLIGFDRYSSLSVDTNAEKIEDFANLHTCVNLAREEIKLLANVPSLLKETSATATTASTKTYSLPSDFDIPVKVFYTQDSEEFEIDQVYPENLLQVFDNTTAEGTPSAYMILGQASSLVQIKFYDTPSKAGSYKAIYKPILTELTTSTDSDVLMTKYPKAVIDLATSFAFEIIKKDTKRADEYYARGLDKIAKISFRETNANSNFKELPPALLRQRRQTRLSK